MTVYCGQSQPRQSKHGVVRVEPLVCGKEAEVAELPAFSVTMCPVCDRQPGYLVGK